MLKKKLPGVISAAALAAASSLTHAQYTNTQSQNLDEQAPYETGQMQNEAGEIQYQTGPSYEDAGEPQYQTRQTSPGAGEPQYQMGQTEGQAGGQMQNQADEDETGQRQFGQAGQGQGQAGQSGDTTVQDIVGEYDWYFGGSLGWYGIGSGDAANDPTSLAIFGRVGAFVNENVSAEVRLGMGLGDHDVTVGVGDAAVPGSFQLDQFYGFYLRGGLPLDESFYPYLMLGVTRGHFSLDYAEVSRSDTVFGLSYGLGVDIELPQGVSQS